MTRGPYSQSAQMWSVRRADGKEFGPYSTEAILKLITDGSLVGTEYIRALPDGKWLLISRQGDFYDQLLQVLEQKSQPVKKNKNSAGNTLSTQKSKLPLPNEETVINIPKSASKSKESESADEDFLEKTVVLPSTLKKEVQSASSTSTKAKTAKSENTKSQIRPMQQTSVIDLEDLGQAARKAKVRSAVVPTAILFFAVLIAVVAFWLPQEPTGKQQPTGKRNLVVPKSAKGQSLNPEQVRQGIGRAVSLYIQDTYESYLEAQKSLVDVIEGSTQNAEARGFLCLVYKELWPYSKQDAKDLEAVNFMAKSTRSIEPVGINSTYCDLIRLMTAGRYKEARGAVEYALNQNQFSAAPVLYAIRAELIAEEGDARTARLYAEKAVELWPEWLRPQFDLAKYAMAANDPQEALRRYQNIFSKQPAHKKSQIEYGLMLLSQFRQMEESEKILSAALASPQKVDGLTEARALFALAQIAQARNSNPQAIDYAQKAFSRNPGDKRIQKFLEDLGAKGKASISNNELIFLGDQYFRTGNCLAAQAEYKTAFDLDPKNALAAMKAAKCLWQLSQSSQAITYLNKSIQADPKYIAAYVLLADYQSARFDFVAASQTLIKAQRVDQNNYEVLRGYGLIELRRNNPRDAAAYLQRAQKIFENDVDTLVLLARAQSLNKEYQSAQQAAVRAIEIDGTNVEAQVVYAQILASAQGVDTGVVYLRDLISRFAYTIQYREALANLYVDAERYIEAQRMFRQLLDANPRNKLALLGLGRSLQGQNLFDPALRAYLAAGTVDPSDAEPLFRAGLLYLETGKVNDAITQFRRAFRVNGNYPQLNYYIGKAALLGGDTNLALSSAMEERKINPNLADSYILAAEVYAQNKDYTKCAQEYQQASKLRPQGADIYIKMARCYRQSGSPDVAESMLLIASNKESGNPEIYKEQGAVFEQRGDSRAAAEAYEKYLALSPNAPDRNEVRGRINSLGQ